MAKWAQDFYTVKNPHKYVGKNKPRYRSSWELVFMQFCDNNDNILQWASEAIKIPYKHPFTGKPTIYVPDFFVVYQNKYGKQIAEIVEIKPKKQSIIESKRASAQLQATVAINRAKWQAATAYCQRIGITFRVITEDDIFYNGRK